jgi:creatinine amidohydrolase/Fe(II)-dependent formamide hydrolase-like protein
MIDFVPDAFSPEQIEMMKAAFDAAWQFVQADTVLDSMSLPQRQAVLAQAVMAIAAKGEKGALHVANDAIAQVRKVYALAPRSRQRPGSST